MRCWRQSSLACSRRSREDETKFQKMKRSPIGAPFWGTPDLTLGRSQLIVEAGAVPEPRRSSWPMVSSRTTDYDIRGFTS